MLLRRNGAAHPSRPLDVSTASPCGAGDGGPVVRAAADHQVQPGRWSFVKGGTSAADEAEGSATACQPFT